MTSSTVAGSMWPYSVVAALEPAARLGPWYWMPCALAGHRRRAGDVYQIREVVERFVSAGQWTEGDPEILVLACRCGCASTGHNGPLPIIAGTVIRLEVEHLPSGGEAKPVWLWWSEVTASATEIDYCWQAFMHRFDFEHTFRLLKQTLGWTAPQLRDPQAADRWTWLIIACHRSTPRPGH